ncbi:MAG TPA: two-component regulator propeller domain-containing protein [Puia sp.]|nr:two-component regulator propeller domain-containing protein [Puia sp.]
MLFVAAPGLRAQLLPIRNYTTREGLNANSINAILRDSRGMLWVGTYNGVNWYDGERFLHPMMRTRSGQIYVTRFMEDRRHDVWIATWYSGLYKYAGGAFTNFLPDSEHISDQANSIIDVAELDSGRYLAGTDRNAWLFDGRHFTLLDPANPMLNQQIHALLYTPRGDILIGLPQGLAWYRKKGSAWENAGLLMKDVDIDKMAAIGERLWITCSRGLYYIASTDAFLDGATGRDGPRPKTNSPELLLPPPVDNVFPQSGNDCWYTEGKIGASLLRDGHTVRQISKANGLPSAFVKTLYTDAEGITWLGTEYGLAKLTPAGYRFFSIQEDTATDANIIALEKDTSGALWFGTYQGLYRMQGNAPREFKQPNGAHCGFVFNLLRDRRSRLWACTATGIYTIEKDRVRRWDNRTATVISEDRNGDIWFGCTDGRILHLDEKGIRQLHQANPIDERIAGIYHDAAGFLWVGYALSGIRKFRALDDSLRLEREFPGDSGNLLVRNMLADGKGHLLVGTRTGGLYILDSTGTLGPAVTMEQGLSGNWIKGIATGAGRILLATNNGLDILDARRYPFAIRHVPFNDGRVPSEFNTICLHRDTIWLGTARGVLEYVPGSQLPDKLPPPVYVMRTLINGRTDSSFGLFAGENQLPPLHYAQNNLSFDFAGLSFRDESAVRYRYRLEGLDKDWSPPTDRRYVNYGNLGPGDYRFLVIAAGDDGVWSTRPATIAFTIEAPFWRTPWFLTLCTLGILALAYALYRFRLNQVLRIERLRHKISTDLHDDIGSTLSSISILSDMALQEEEVTRPAPSTQTILPTGHSASSAPHSSNPSPSIHPVTPAASSTPHSSNPSPSIHPVTPAASSPVLPAGHSAPATMLPAMIREIRDNSLSLLEKMDDIVWSINPRNDTLESLMLRVRRFAAQLFEARGIEYDIDIEPGIRHLRLQMEHRQNLYLIMKEAINNLVKYANAYKATIRVQAVRNHLVVQITDDGNGFDEAAGRTGNGIMNMKDRAAVMRADLAIDTAPGHGTTVMLTVKIS